MLKLRITKCYLVEVVNEKGYVQEVENASGLLEVADEYVFGTKEDAIKVGKRLMQWVKDSRKE